MTPQEIKDRLDALGISQGALGRKLRRSKSTAHLLIHKKMKSKRLEERLAKILEVSVEELRANGEEQKAS